MDDNVDAAASLAMLLESSGHTVRVEHDGPPALAAAAAFRPDVVLLDIGLPGLNGLEVAKRLRSAPNPAGAVLVALTGYGNEADRQQTHATGFDHHLVKPTDFKNLEQLLGRIAAKPL